MKRIPKILSKTTLLKGYQCHKCVYLTIHNRELATPPDAAKQAIFNQGHLVGAEARKHFPGGVLVDQPYYDFVGSIQKTKELIASGAEIIYEAAFEYSGCYARADILQYSNESKKWNIFEVKSSTSVKEENIDDISLQAWIIANSGLPIETISLMHINNQCVYPDLNNLFTTVDLTQAIRDGYKEIRPRLIDILDIIKQPSVPDIGIGEHCSKPYDCDFMAHCWKENRVPALSVLDLPKIGNKKWELYNEGIIDLNDERLTDLSTNQQRMVDVFKSGNRFINSAGVKDEMSEWEYPYIYIDFESISPAIPRYNGTRPYQQVPFQLSVHIQTSPDSPLKHIEYLHTSDNDPRDEIIPVLLNACGNAGSIIAYYMKYESDRIKELALYSPEHTDELTALLDRIVDPLPVIRNNVYDNEFKGSFGLKYTAPALLGNEASYKGMDVADGTAAQRAYDKMRSPDTKPTEKVMLEKALLEYCKKDTLVMVDLVQWLAAC